MSIYFLDIWGYSFLISPNINREFGLLENAQLLLLISSFVVFFKTKNSVGRGIETYLFYFVLLGIAFLILEEMDYGIHFYEWLTLPEYNMYETKIKTRNIHNQGELLKWIKWFSYLCLIVVFVFLPYKGQFLNRIKWIKPFVPSKLFVFTILSMIICNQFALYMDQNLKEPNIYSLDGNVSEFEELFIYYIGFLYTLDVTNEWKKSRKAGNLLN